jgi:hypothetical protein
LDFLTLEDKTDRFPKTLIRNYQYMMRNIPEEHRSHQKMLLCASLSTEPLRHTQNAHTDPKILLTFMCTVNDWSPSLATLSPVKEAHGAHQTDNYHNSKKYYIMH